MKRTITTTLLAAASLAGTAALATPASADTAPRFDNEHTSSNVVAEGTIEGLRGNRHQVRINTSEGEVLSSSRIRSYYCPRGVSISPTWASSKCVLRNTYSLTNFRQNYETSYIGNMSSTKSSATQVGPVLAQNPYTGKQLLLNSGIKMFGNQPADDAHVAVRGTFGGRALGTKRHGDFGTAE